MLGKEIVEVVLMKALTNNTEPLFSSTTPALNTRLSPGIFKLLFWSLFVYEGTR